MRNTYHHIYILCKWIRKILYVCVSTTSPRFLIQQYEPWNFSTIILKEKGLNSWISFVQKSWETRHFFFLIGWSSSSNVKVIQSEGFALCSPGRKLKPVGVVICSEAINSWGCFSPVSDPVNAPWLHPSLSRMWRKLENSMWPQNT